MSRQLTPMNKAIQTNVPFSLRKWYIKDFIIMSFNLKSVISFGPIISFSYIFRLGYKGTFYFSFQLKTLVVETCDM